MTSIPTDIKYIVRIPGVYGGKPCIEGHRIAVHDIAERHNEGYSPEQITSDHFPTLTLAEVYAALLYYYDHKDEIDREIAEEAADIKAQAQAHTSRLAQRIREGIKQRKDELARQAEV